MIAIHKSNSGFHPRWIEYCNQNEIPYKLVDAYASDVVFQLKGAKAFMWHHHHTSAKDILFARQLLFALEQAGVKVFPSFNTAWHFDDKIGQKYLLEAIDAPAIPTWVFYEKKQALEWASKMDFPAVFKLRRGAGSAHVSLIRTKQKAERIINKAFNGGFDSYNAWENLKERVRKYKHNKTNAYDVFKGIVRLACKPRFSDVAGKEKGYVYFQKFIPSNDHDIRIVVVGSKAFAIKRMVRDGDFRASGSGNILYDKSIFREDVVKLSFKLTNKLGSQCVAFDFIFQGNAPLVVEISYGFSADGYDLCPGYWDKDMVWHEGRFNPYGWMVENLIQQNEN